MPIASLSSSPGRVRGFLALVAAAVLAAAAAASPFASNGGLSSKELAQGFRDGRVLAKPRLAMLPTIDSAERGEGLSLIAKFERFGNVRVVRLAPGDTVKAAIQRLMATGRYVYVEPDYLRHVTAVPDDPQFSSQWGLNNTGAQGGIPGADIRAEAGWDTLTSASNVIVGIVDSGAITTHQDLAANMWVNPSPGTSKSYADGDGATIEVDSLNGLNAVTGSGLPTDDVGHGTHVSGIVGAVGNNAVGVSGVAWKVQLMELKFIDSSGSGSTSDELPCIEYAISHNAKVLNASFGDQSFSQAEMDAIYAAGQAGVIFVCAAGNASEDNDTSPFFPADYPLDNMITVGASDNRDLPVYFSNYGSGSVEIFAPGENILSTYFSSNSSYAYLSGTSMASPMVAGTVALLRSKFPSDTYRETINRVLNSADTNPGLEGKAQTGGRVDLGKALTTAANTPPNVLFANRTILVGLEPYTRTNNADSPVALESGTPQIAGMAGSHSLWWQWTAPENATVEIDTSGTSGGSFNGGSTYPTLLGVYTGTSLGSLVLIKSNANFGTETLEGGSTQSYSEVSFPTKAGVTYQINVQGQGTASGQTLLAINPSPDNLSNATPTVLSGPSASFLDCNNTSNGQPLWYSWTPAFSGPAEVSAYSYDFTVKATVYTGTPSSLTSVASSQGSATAGTTTMISECLCPFTAVAGTTYLISVSGVSAGDLGDFTVSVDDALWQATTGDAVTCSPAIAPDGSVYVGSNDNIFYAYNPNGTVKWTHTAGAVFDTSSAAIGPDGSVYAGCTDGNLYAFSSAGILNWTYTVPTPAASSGLDNGLSSSPALGPDGTLYFHDDDGHLYALTSAGALKWTAPVSGVSYAAPTVAGDGTIYLGSDNGIFYAFNPDGSVKWTFTQAQGDEIYTAAAIDLAGNLYFGTLGGYFYSVSPTGSQRWVFSTSPTTDVSTGASISSAPALANGAVYFGGYDGFLYSLSAATGAVNWKYPLGTQVRASAPAVDSNGVVYIGCYDHNVYAISQTGALVRTYVTDDYIRSSPVIIGTTLCFGSEDHKVYAFNIAAGPAASDWPMYQFNAQRVGRAVTAAIIITSQPSSQFVAPGSPFTLSVGAVGQGAVTYQWYVGGVAIPGAVNSTYSVSSATQADAGNYTVTVTSGANSVTSEAAIVTVSSAGRLTNIATRAFVGTGGNIEIAGISITGPSGTTKQVLIRGDGPALAAFNLSGVLASTSISVFDASGNLVVSDTGWGNPPVAGNSTVGATFRQATRADMNSVEAFFVADGSADSALVANLPPGNYTVELSGPGSATGIGLVEVYEMDPVDPLVFTDIATRAEVIGEGNQGDLLIGGFFVGGTQPANVLVRGSGPALALAPFGLSGTLAHPVLGIYDPTGAVIATDTGWGSAPVQGSSISGATFRAATAADMAAAGAFAFSPGSLDCAMVLTLPPGAYTAEVNSGDGTNGIALIEVYLLP